MKPIQGAIFDLDGTLLDSMWVWKYVDEEFLTRRHLPKEPDYLEKLGPMGFHRAAIYTKEHFQLSDSVEEIWEEWGRLAKNAYDNEVRMKPGAAEYLRMLKKRGVRIGAATSNHEELFSGTLKRCGVYDYFDAFTMTSEVSRGKDFPDVYLLCAERLGVQPAESAVFEDIAAGLRGAKSGGFYTVAVKEPLSAPQEKEIKLLADQYITDFYELL